MKTIDEIRKAFLEIHDSASGKSDRAYMSIPADTNRDADLIVSAAIDELERLRAESAKLRAFAVDMAREKLLHGSNPTLLVKASRLDLPEVAELLTTADKLDYVSPLTEARRELKAAEEKVARLEAENAALLNAFPEYGSTGNELREERARTDAERVKVARLRDALKVYLNAGYKEARRKASVLAKQALATTGGES